LFYHGLSSLVRSHNHRSPVAFAIRAVLLEFVRWRVHGAVVDGERAAADIRRLTRPEQELSRTLPTAAQQKVGEAQSVRGKAQREVAVLEQENLVFENETNLNRDQPMVGRTEYRGVMWVAYSKLESQPRDSLKFNLG